MDHAKTLRHFKLLTSTDAFARRITSNESGASVLHARLVFSWLAYRSRIHHGASTRSLCKELGLHPNSVASAIQSLGDLVVRRGNEWMAVQPPESLFVPMKLNERPEHWADRIAYVMMYLPIRGAKIEYPETSRRFGLNHALIWSYLVGKAKTKAGVVRDFTCSGAEKIFGLNVKTISSIVNDLHWAKLITREEYGRGSNITLVANEVALLEFFQPKPKAEAATKVEPVEKKSPSAPAAYQFNNDIWDQGRRLCQPLMPQSTCEAIIKKALRLGDSADQFENAVVAAKRRHDDNLKSGNVFKGNFGKFLTAIYDNRIAAVEEQLKKEIKESTLHEFLNSDEFKEKQKALEQEAAADPNHPQHIFTIDSILDRVQFSRNPVRNRQSADSLLTNLRRLIRSNVASTEPHSVEEENEIVHRIAGLIMKPALSKLNEYYRQEIRASFDDMKRELGLSIRMNAPGLRPTDKSKLSIAVEGVDNRTDAVTPP